MATCRMDRTATALFLTFPRRKAAAAAACACSSLQGRSFSTSPQQQTDSPHDTATPSSALRTTPQRVGIIGAGAVGLYYGARLCVAGHEVHAVLRDPVQRHTIRSQGLNIYSSVTGDVTVNTMKVYCHAQSMLGKMQKQVQHINHSDDNDENGQSSHDVTLSTGPEENDAYFDWVIVSLKTTAVNDIPRRIQSAVHPERTRVILAMNGNGLDEHFRQRLRCRALYGGCVFVCAEKNLEPAGIVYHSGYSGIALGLEHAMDPTEDHYAIAKTLFTESSAIDLQWEPCLRKGRWKKALINIPFNGLSVVKGEEEGLLVNEILAQHRRLAYDLVEEVALLANADLKDHGIDDLLVQDDVDKALQVVEGIGPFAPSTLMDFQKKAPLEYRWMFRYPLERAQQLNLDTPLLTWLVSEVSSLRTKYKLY